MLNEKCFLFCFKAGNLTLKYFKAIQESDVPIKLAKKMLNLSSNSRFIEIDSDINFSILSL